MIRRAAPLAIVVAAVLSVAALGWLKTISLFFVAVPILNAYYVGHGWMMYRTFQPPSRILRLMFGIKLVSFLAGCSIAYIAVAVLLDIRPIPYVMWALIGGLLAILVIPAMVHVTVVRMLATRE